MCNKKRILFICNNYDSPRDGIGKYTKVIENELRKFNDVEEVYIETGYTDDSDKIKMLKSMEMTLALNRAIKLIVAKKITDVIVEYPFQEYNPLIIIQFYRLSRLCNKRIVSLSVSVHEYLRAKKLRQFVVRFMSKLADITFVTDYETGEALSYYAKRIERRDMIGVIFPESDILFEAKDDNSFIYFGLVNRSKAFAEMLEAWSVFNKSGKFFLKIITSSDISFFDVKQKGIKVYHSLSEKEVSEHFKTSSYAIMPIRPEITVVNGTFKTAALFGCICIGKFSEDLKKGDFLIHVENYKKETFAEGLLKASQLLNTKKKEMFDNALIYGKKFSPHNTAEQVLKAIRKLKQEDHDVGN